MRDKTGALLADGERGVMGFYVFTGKHPSDVTELGDVAAAQTVLGHENQQTTREYLKTVAVKKDKYSGVIAARFGFDDQEDV